MDFSVLYSVWTCLVVASTLGLLAILTKRMWSRWYKNAGTVVVERAVEGKVIVSVRLKVKAWMEIAMLTVFIVSFVFEWVRVYQEEEARRMVTILKVSTMSLVILCM